MTAQPRIFAPDNSGAARPGGWQGTVGAFFNAFDLSAATLRAYASDLRNFAEYFQRVNGRPVSLDTIAPTDVSGFRDALRAEGRATSTVNRQVATVRKLLAWAIDDELLPADRLPDVKALRIVPRGALGLSKADARRLLRECELRRDKRAHAVFSLLLHTGLRVSELAALANEDVSLGERSGWAVVRSGKGRKERTVAVPQSARVALLAYREGKAVVGWHKLFRGRCGALGPDGVRHLCEGYSKRLDIRFTPHTLRHTFAHSYLEANPGDIVGLADALGHSRIDTTRIYTRPTAADQLERSERVSY